MTDALLSSVLSLLCSVWISSAMPWHKCYCRCMCPVLMVIVCFTMVIRARHSELFIVLFCVNCVVLFIGQLASASNVPAAAVNQSMTFASRQLPCMLAACFW